MGTPFRIHLHFVNKRVGWLEDNRKPSLTCKLASYLKLDQKKLIKLHGIFLWSYYDFTDLSRLIFWINSWKSYKYKDYIGKIRIANSKKINQSEIMAKTWNWKSSINFSQRPQFKSATFMFVHEKVMAQLQSTASFAMWDHITKRKTFLLIALGLLDL